MKTLTKDEVQRLAPEAQEAYGTAVARDLQHRLNLIARTRQPRWLHAFDGVAYMVIISITIWPNWRYGAMFALILLLAYTQWQAARINRRLDALSELVESRELDVHTPTPGRSNPPD